MIDREIAITEQPPAAIEVHHGREDAIEIRLIVDQTVGTPSTSRDERERGNLVLKGQDRLFGSSFILTGVSRDNPERIGALLLRPLAIADDRLDLSVGVHLGCAEAVSGALRSEE